MKQQEGQYRRYVIFSALLHIFLLLVLIVGVDFFSPLPVVENADNKNMISAVVMNPSVEKTPHLNPKPIPPKPAPPPKPIAQAIAKELPRVIPVEKPKPVEIKKDVIALEKIKKQKQLQEDHIQQQLLADLKKQKEQKEKKQIQAKKVQQQKELEKSLENEMKNLAAKSLPREASQEQQRLSDARAQKAQGVVDKYKALILQAISQRWLVPSTVNRRLSCQLLIRVAPGGMVLDVQIAKSSGDEALDQSARLAVLKASPLPVPKEADAFSPFKQFVLKVKPENLLTDSSWIN